MAKPPRGRRKPRKTVDPETLLTSARRRRACAVAQALKSSADGGEPWRTYAIGDVHGVVDALLGMLEAIVDDADGRPVRIVTLGDYIDRGDSSAQVVEALRTMQAAAGGSLVCLAGNHERKLIAALGDPGDSWHVKHAATMMRSYGLKPERTDRLPQAHVAWIASLPCRFRSGGTIYVHAGLRPGTPFEDQSDHDVTTIRTGFLDSDADFGGHVLHGHSQRPDPERRRNRTGIDTGAVYGGALTAAVIEPGSAAPIGFISLRRMDGDWVRVGTASDDKEDEA